MAKNLGELKTLENSIRAALQPHTIDSVLCGLWNKAKPDGFPNPFMIAGTIQFALRYCAPAFRSTKPSLPLDWQRLSAIVNLATQYVLSDPVGFDETVPDGLLSIMLRHVGNQFPSASIFFGQHARSLILYRDMPQLLMSQKGIPKFDFLAAFEHVNGASVENFVDVGYVTFMAAHSNPGFDLGYFRKAREEGMSLPNDETVSAVLDRLAADPIKFRALDAKYKQDDRRFAAYDFNPLFPFPIIRPWQQSKRTGRAQDRMTAPLPELILWRISTGVYYQMREQYKEFLSYFGHLFEAYVGEVLRHCVPKKSLLSEHEIRAVYSTNKGKVPDWVVIDGDTAILIECKATQLKRLALATGSEEAITSSVGQITSGLKQLQEFMLACQSGDVDLPALKKCCNYCPVVMTFEPLYLANSTVFRELLEGLVDKDVTGLPWLILSLDELEQLQPHIAAGLAMGELFGKIREQLFPNVLEEAHRRTGCTYEDTFLHEKEQELYDRLGIGGR